MRICFLSLVLLLGISCNRTPKISDFELTMDSLKQVIPTMEVTENQIFSFTELSKNIWDWQTVQKFEKIDTVFWNNYLNKFHPLNGYNYFYQKNYFYKIIDFENNYFNLIILQNQGDTSYMYLIQFDRQGNRKKVCLLASISKSPDDYEEIHSSIQNNKITTYKYYNDDGSIKKDTIVSFW